MQRHINQMINRGDKKKKCHPLGGTTGPNWSIPLRLRTSHDLETSGFEATVQTPLMQKVYDGEDKKWKNVDELNFTRNPRLRSHQFSKVTDGH